MTAINNSLPAFSFNDQPQIYVACLASYNNGELHGQWIDATQEVEEIKKQIAMMLSDSPEPGAEEYVIHDDMGFYDLEIEEYDSIEDVQEKAMFILEHGELGAKVAAYYGGDLEDAQKSMNENYQDAYKSELDYAIAFFDECYLDTVPESVRFYIDYESFKTDIFIDTCFSIELGGKSHIFFQH
ncbi:MAG TPA: antirestriction protein ArdA [Gammaproteobacteria bacterium]|nr:antirestriction protein ArdA [Gammaproteobacteria bacterium]